MTFDPTTDGTVSPTAHLLEELAVTLGRLYRRCMVQNDAGAAAQPIPVAGFGTGLAVASIPQAASSAAADARHVGEPGVNRRYADAARLDPPSRRQRGVANLAAAAMAAAVFMGAGLFLHWQPERTPTTTIGRSEQPGRATAPAAENAAAASAPLVEPPVRSRALLPAGSIGAAAAVAPTAPAVNGARALLLARDLGADVFSPSFVDDGRGVLFHAGRTRGALMRASFDDRGEATVVPVIRDDAANFHASLSPDGRSLAFDSDRDGSRGVYVARANGEGAEKVSGDGLAVAPRWSPDGRTLAFVRAEPSRPRVWNVWTMDVQTRTLTRISRHRVGQAWAPSWFPDGQRLAYSVEDTLVIVDLSSGRSRVHRSPVRGRLVRTPAVSPDGRRIVFQVFRDGVWMLDLGSGRLRRILDDVTAEEFAWGPAGDAVAYHAKTGGAWSIWQLPLAAGTS